ncbi:MAG: hypothetical protein HKN09_06320 [Saprospiraceae bacterium]|nr:hypothetical protein [Saprospiraceae bacterium]
MKKEYSNGEITVTWEPNKCIHSGNCVRGLSSVFKPNEKPWIKVENASSEEMMKVIDNCPSGALGYYKNAETSGSPKAQDNVPVQIIDGGPIMIQSTCKIIHKDGSEELRENKVALCRCGASTNKPYCDGSHRQIEFDK